MTPPPTIDFSQRARDLLALGKFDLARREAQRGLQSDPHNADLHYLLGWALWQQDHLTQAADAARSALRLDPDDAHHHSPLALILQETPLNFRSAEAAHHQALALEPNEAVFHLRYADYLRCDQQWGLAWEQATQALALDPRLVGAHLLKARILIQQRRFREAEPVLHAALALDPLNAACHEALGDFYLDQYQPQPAFPAYRQALRLQPTNPRYKRKLIQTLETGLPLVGRVWRFTHLLHVNERNLILYYLVCFPILCCLLNPQFLPLFLLVACVDVFVAGFFLILTFGVEPWITQAVLDGRVKLG